MAKHASKKTGLTPDQKYALLLIVLVIGGSLTGMLFYMLMNRGRERSSTLESKSPVKLTATPTPYPAATPFNPAANMQYHDIVNLYNIKFASEIGLRHSTATKVVKQRLQDIHYILEKVLNLSTLEKEAIANSEIALARRDYMHGADAMVEPNSGRILISSDLSPNKYPSVLRNKIFHKLIRHVNIKLLGDDLAMPEKKMVLFYPYLTTNWQIDENLRVRFMQALSDDLSALGELEIFHKDKKLKHGLFNDIITPDTRIIKQTTPEKIQKIQLINSHYSSANAFFLHFNQRIAAARSVSFFINGGDQVAIELASDIYELPLILQDTLFERTSVYLSRYIAKVENLMLDVSSTFHHKK